MVANALAVVQESLQRRKEMRFQACVSIVRQANTLSTLLLIRRISVLIVLWGRILLPRAWIPPTSASIAWQENTAKAKALIQRTSVWVVWQGHTQPSLVELKKLIVLNAMRENIQLLLVLMMKANGRYMPTFEK
jgi:hypothetical protein